VYKGVAIATDGSDNFIYAANFHGHTVDVFDKSFNLVTTKPFSDPNIPSNYGPFNIANLGGKLYVTYAVPRSPSSATIRRAPASATLTSTTRTGRWTSASCPTAT